MSSNALLIRVIVELERIQPEACTAALQMAWLGSVAALVSIWTISFIVSHAAIA